MVKTSPVSRACILVLAGFSVEVGTDGSGSLAVRVPAKIAAVPLP